MNPAAIKALEEALLMSDLPEDQQEELLLELTEIVSEGVLLRITEQMSIEERNAFADLLDTNPSEEEVEAFITAHVPNADALVEETIQGMQDDILAVTGAS